MSKWSQYDLISIKYQNFNSKILPILKIPQDISIIVSQLTTYSNVLIFSLQHSVN